MCLMRPKTYLVILRSLTRSWHLIEFIVENFQSTVVLSQGRKWHILYTLGRVLLVKTDTNTPLTRNTNVFLLTAARTILR